MTRMLERRGFLAGLGGLAGAAALSPLSGGTAQAAVRSFIALGDSYTAAYRSGIPSWAQQIKNSGSARLIVNLARSGARVTGTDSLSTFDGQVDAWIRNYKSQGIPDRTVVYLGYNNIGGSATTVRTAYRRQIDRLIANGVTQGGRRLVLCLLHDWSRNPGCTSASCESGARAWVISWNSFVQGVAGSHANCTTVNLFAKFEDVDRHPGAYGFTNVTSPNLARSSSTHLYADTNHFGRKGQAIIAGMVKPKLIG